MPETDPLPRAWSFRVPLPVWTVNAERGMHYRTHGNLTRDYRKAAALLARNARIPALDRVAVEATPFGPQIRQDVGACNGSTKAAIDGLVDARILPDDTLQHVCRITHHQPRKGPHGLHVLVIDLGDLPPDHGTYQALLPIGATA